MLDWPSYVINGKCSTTPVPGAAKFNIFQPPKIARKNMMRIAGEDRPPDTAYRRKAVVIPVMMSSQSVCDPPLRVQRKEVGLSLRKQALRSMRNQLRLTLTHVHR